MNATRALTMAVDLVRYYVGAEWSVYWNHSRVTFGTCHEMKRRLTLSRPLSLVNTEERVLTTILHEIAHALTPPPNPWATFNLDALQDYAKANGHTDEWRKVCREIGGDGVPCFSWADKGGDVARPPEPSLWVGLCFQCGEVKFTQPRQIVNLTCPEHPTARLSWEKESSILGESRRV